MRYKFSKANIESFRTFYELTQAKLGHDGVRKFRVTLDDVCQQTDDKEAPLFVDLSIEEQDLLLEFIELAKQTIPNFSAKFGEQFNSLYSALKSPVVNEE